MGGYREAVTQPLLRQRFLDNLLHHHPRKAIVRAVYNDKRETLNAYLRSLLPGTEWKYDRAAYRGVINSSTRDHHSYMYTYLPDVMMGKNVPAMILVNGQAFASLAESTFNVVLFGHEHQHAKDFYHGITLPDGTRVDGTNLDDVTNEVCTILFETRALHAEIKMFRELGKTSCARYPDLFDFLRTHAGAIQKATPKAKIEEKILAHQERYVQRILQKYEPAK